MLIGDYRSLPSPRTRGDRRPVDARRRRAAGRELTTRDRSDGAPLASDRQPWCPVLPRTISSPGGVCGDLPCGHTPGELDYCISVKCGMADTLSGVADTLEAVSLGYGDSYSMRARVQSLTGTADARPLSLPAAAHQETEKERERPMPNPRTGLAPAATIARQKVLPP